MRTNHHIVFATNNEHKLSEVKRKLPGLLIKSLKEIGCYEELPETSDTLKGNALQKARHVYNKYKMSCFADDTGLEVEILDGRPGVYSARYAGSDCKAEDNIRKLLSEMEGSKNRTARFVTVIALIIDHKEYFFSGEVKGIILPQKQGGAGFGYDTVFKPDCSNKSFAEMTMEEKNSISHRGKAVKAFSLFLTDHAR